MKLLTLLSTLTILTCAAQSAKILGIFHVNSFSHYVMGNVLLKELAARGHEVTMISSMEDKSPPKNYRQIVLPEIVDFAKKNERNIMEFETIGALEMIKLMQQFTVDITNATLNSTGVQKLLKSNEKFDLVIMEQFMNEAFRGFQYFYDAPCIIFSTVGATSWVNRVVGNPENPAYIPELMTGFAGRQLSLLQRVQNTFVYLALHLVQYFYTYRVHNEIMHTHFPNAPEITDLLYNTSLVLLNSHVSYSQPKPLVSNMVEVGGLHISPSTKKLPKDLQTFLDSAKDGAIYFSLGGNVKSKYFPAEKRDAFLKVFSKLKMKVLWKFESDDIQNLPSNVKIDKWFPQQEILAHPNVKLFISHGGLVSTIETIYHGKPVLGIPFFGDQKMNMQSAVNNGYAVKLNYHDLTEETISSALNEVLTNPTYAKNAKKRSQLLQDQQVKPLDRAVYWVEYVLRHKGAYHLRSGALDLEWYQYFMLDVILIAISPFVLVFLVVRAGIKRVCRKKPVTKKEVSRNKKKN